ncbi:MAG: S8 family serine peptidase [bacterium]|nr:S8 family serine peptidase [bacterium]
MTMEAIPRLRSVRLIEPDESKDAEIPAGQAQAWGIEAVGALNSEYTGTAVVVAVLDSGIDHEHPGFEGIEIIERDFSGEGNGDLHGHGTHCAGTIFGRDVDGVRIGVARGVQKALIGKVTNRVGIGSTEQVVSAVQWAVEGGAHIILMSLSIDFPGFAEQLRRFRGFPPELAFSKALEHYRENLLLFDRLASFVIQHRNKPLLVAAAGNESRRHERADFEIAAGPPAALDGVVAVGSLDRNLRVANTSNTRVDLVAPGVKILSAKAGGGLEYKSGTSQAGPHVAGVAALWAQKLMARSSLGVTNLRARLIAAASEECLAPGCDPFAVGEGLVQAPRG